MLVFLQVLKSHGIAVQSFSELLSAGQAKPAEPVPPKPEDYCTIMYTSGTTGTAARHVAVLSVVWSLLSSCQILAALSVLSAVGVFPCSSVLEQS